MLRRREGSGSAAGSPRRPPQKASRTYEKNGDEQREDRHRPDAGNPALDERPPHEGLDQSNPESSDECAGQTRQTTHERCGESSDEELRHEAGREYAYGRLDQDGGDCADATGQSPRERGDPRQPYTDEPD